ncbi:MAG: PD-(D/E)XK nuclease family protein [Ruthenibacterium lactatiformans]
MERAAAPQPFHAADAKALEQLLGTQLTLSPTRVEQYYRCRFSYFLQYVLRICRADARSFLRWRAAAWCIISWST